MVYYRKWRPQTLSEIVGQEHVTTTLLNALKTGKIAHAYLFSGPRGTGKTSTGRILAKAVNCLQNGKGEPCNSCSICKAITEGRSLDLIEIDAASNRGIDDIRELRERVNYAPSQARYKVYIIDEVHMLTEPASNALLKTLEEPPPYVIFILATTEPHNVLPTIRSRCQHFTFHRLSLEAIVSRLKMISEKEGLEVSSEALKLIARSATGSMRDAENILEQLVNYYGNKIELWQVRELLGITTDFKAKELVRQIMRKDLSGGLATINKVSSEGLDLRAFLREVVEYLRGLLLLKAGSEEAIDATQDEIAEMKMLARDVPLDFIYKATKIFSSLRIESYSPLPLELALVESIGQEIEGMERVEVKATPLAKEEIKPVEGELSLAGIKQRWREFVSSLKGKGSSGDLDARLRSACEPIKLEGNVLELGFKYQYHFEKLNDPKYIFLVEQGLKEFYGVPLKLKLTLLPRPQLNQLPIIREALKEGARIVKIEKEGE